MEDPTAVATFPVKGGGPHAGASLLAWTTTPWTLPSNLALCVNEAFEYIKVWKGVAGHSRARGWGRGGGRRSGSVVRPATGSGSGSRATTADHHRRPGRRH